ncbi:techylectin-5A [Caerostris darwini]|uniref:Techylectin-5A n=1 Tax=Caerostris darwini TaxID=1538125 RepID=A0AAV4VF05_9ARAC|nr:techylectin-5A [Caerostris darwini]
MGKFSEATEAVKRHSCFCGIIRGVICAAGIIIAAVFPPRVNNTSCADTGKAFAMLQLAESLLSKAKELSPTYEDIPRIAETSDALQQDRPRDCSEILDKDNSRSGVYTVWPSGGFKQGKSIRVYCDMSIDGNSKERKLSKKQDFNLEWEDYKNGFGDLTEEFWLGNENIYALTNQGECEIRFDMQDNESDTRFAVYSNFKIDDESSGYVLHIGNYSGNAGDAMKYHDGQQFKTKETNAGADFLQGGWWIFEWAYAHLNGRLIPGENEPRSIHWHTWKQNIGLASVEMKIRLK